LPSPTNHKLKLATLSSPSELDDIMSQALLALPETAQSEQTGWRRRQDLVDALPYVDALSPEEKKAIDQLIEDEVRSGTHSKEEKCCASASCLLDKLLRDQQLQMRNSSKRPADYMNELPPVPSSRILVSALFIASLPLAMTAPFQLTSLCLPFPVPVVAGCRAMKFCRQS
jgi:hypothetical protein